MNAQERLEHFNNGLRIEAQHIRLLADTLVKTAADVGLVVEIQTAPCAPPAMGNYVMAVDVRPELAVARRLLELQEQARRYNELLDADVRTAEDQAELEHLNGGPL